MKNILLLYASMSGSTEQMAFAVAEGLCKKKANVDIIDIFEIHGRTESFDLTRFSGILIGTYTWMDGDIPDEFLSFYNDLPMWDLSKQKVAVFGSYDSLYGNDGAAVDLFVDTLKDAGANVILSPLKIELVPDSNELKICKEFGEEFVAKLQKREKINQAS